MRRKKAFPWTGSLALGCFLFWTLAGNAQAPVETFSFPPVCNFWFVMVRIPATAAGPVGDGGSFPGLTFLNGAQSGAIFSDAIAQNRELLYFGPDGHTPKSAVWQFFGPEVQYNYTYQTETCAKSALTSALAPLLVIPNATPLAGFPLWYPLRCDDFSRPFCRIWSAGKFDRQAGFLRLARRGQYHRDAYL